MAVASGHTSQGRRNICVDVRVQPVQLVRMVCCATLPTKRRRAEQQMRVHYTSIGKQRDGVALVLLSNVLPTLPVLLRARRDTLRRNLFAYGAQTTSIAAATIATPSIAPAIASALTATIAAATLAATTRSLPSRRMHAVSQHVDRRSALRRPASGATVHRVGHRSNCRNASFVRACLLLPGQLRRLRELLRCWVVVR